MSEYIDFKAVKAEVSVEVVASRYGVALKRVNGAHERGKCPLPTHPAGDDAKSFSVNVSKQVWICHSAVCAKGRRGKRGGDVIELVAVMDNCSLRDAALKLASWYGVQPAGETGVESGVEADIHVAPGTRYGTFQSLANWIEERASGSNISTSERGAYLSVLGQIEELARAD